MSEENNFETSDDGAVPKRPHANNEAPSSLILSSFILFCLLGSLLFGALTLLMGRFYGLDANQLAASMGPGAPPVERSFVRWMLVFSHLGTFLLPGILTVALFFKFRVQARGREFIPSTTWPKYLMTHRLPSAVNLTMGIILLIVSIPLVYYLFAVNKMLPLPDWMRTMEGQTNEAIKGILKMDNLGELLANVLVMAFIPAIGEELVFRGIVQQQLMRKIEQPLVAILLTAAIFSAIHMQFEGFFSRCLLGFILGWLYWRTQNFWVPVAAHFFNNAFQVVGQYMYTKNMSSVDLEQDMEVPWFMALGSAFLVFVVMRFIDQTNEKVEKT